MASEKISQLAPTVSVASGDYFPIVTAVTTENKRVDIGVLDVRYTSAASGVINQEAAAEALASGNAALVVGATAQASGNAALTFAETKYAISGGIVTGPMNTVVTDLGQNGFRFVLTSGNYFRGTLSGMLDAEFIDAPAESYGFVYEMTALTGAMTWPTAVKWPQNSPPTVNANTSNIFVFVTDDSGSNWKASAILDYTN